MTLHLHPVVAVLMIAQCHLEGAKNNYFRQGIRQSHAMPIAPNFIKLYKR